MPPPSATPWIAAMHGLPIVSIAAKASCALLGSTLASSTVFISSSIWRMSAPATNEAVPCPVNTTATTSSLRARCSTTITSSSIARSFSALTGALVTVTVATRLPGAHDVVLDQEIAIALEQRLVFGQTLLALPCGDRRLQRIERLRVAQRRGVADLAALDDRAHHAAHVFAGARFGELRHLEEVGGHRDRALFGAHQIGQAAAVVLRQPAARPRA